jgi:hypothetical protein
MEFELQRERLEAQRKTIEAEGIRDAQKIIEQGLSRNIIEWQSIEAFRELSQSPNSKLIITNGKAPFLIESGMSDGESTNTSNTNNSRTDARSRSSAATRTSSQATFQVGGG